tara:strand:+ start:420 stop:641 length:222 start_codon:yes stop_codon:yes gene_type:complete
MTNIPKYQYKTTFWSSYQYDTSETWDTDFSYLTNLEGETTGWRVVSTWLGKQGGQEGIYVLQERPFEEKKGQA